MTQRCILASTIDPADKSLYRVVRLLHGQPRLTHRIERQREPEAAWTCIACVGHEGTDTGLIGIPAAVLHNLLSRIPDR